MKEEKIKELDQKIKIHEGWKRGRKKNVKRIKTIIDEK